MAKARQTNTTMQRKIILPERVKYADVFKTPRVRELVDTTQEYGYRTQQAFISTFQSLSEFVKMSKATPCRKKFFTYDVGKLGMQFDSWTQVFEVMNRPWEQGLKLVDMLKDEIGDLPMPQTVRRRQRWSEYDGDHVCIDRLRAGAPFWRQTRREHTGGPQRITIITNVTTPWYVNAANVFWPAAACIALTDVLEHAGYRVRLIIGDAADFVYYANTGNNYYANVMGITVKDYDASLNKNAIVTGLAPWAYRTVWFRAIAGMHAGVTARENLGYSAPLTPVSHYIVSDDPHCLTIVYDYARNSHSREFATAWIADAIDLIQQA